MSKQKVFGNGFQMYWIAATTQNLVAKITVFFKILTLGCTPKGQSCKFEVYSSYRCIDIFLYINMCQYSNQITFI